MVKLVKFFNFGAVGDGSDKGIIGEINKISNFGAVTRVKSVKLVILVNYR